jgi:integrase
MKLTDTKVKNARAGDREIKLADGQGLYLLITPRGGKLWRWKYRFNGKEKKMSFGVYPDVSLAQARDLRHEAAKLLVSNLDPMAERKAEKIETERRHANSFEGVALAWHEHWKNGKNPDHAAGVKLRLKRDVFPAIGHLPMEKIEAPEIVALVKKVEARGAREIAVRCLGSISQVFRYGIAHGLAQRNPAADIKPSDILKAVPVVNMARVEADELPTLLRRIEMYEGSPVTRLALKLMALTFVRTSELIEARWEEFDCKKRLWIIPKERMKMPSPHHVPLASQTIDALEMLHSITGHGSLLFPGDWSTVKTMSKNTILEALYRMGYRGKMTGHGFRGVASTILHEHGFEHEHIELQLAHMKRDEVSAAYDYSKHLAKRREIMQWWADYLDKARQERSHRLTLVAG